MTANTDSYGGSKNAAQQYLSKKPHVPFYSDTAYKDSYKGAVIKVEKQPAYEYKPNKNKF